MTVAAHSSVSEREQRVLDIIAKQRSRRPKLRDAHITMAHGAGGKATQTLIEGVLVPAFASPALDALADVATIEAGGARLAFTTASRVARSASWQSTARSTTLPWVARARSRSAWR